MNFSYYKLDMNKSIKDNLAFLTIIEYPTFIVISADELHKYDIIGEFYIDIMYSNNVFILCLIIIKVDCLIIIIYV